ncbi:MAG: hypothetical protein KGH63_04420 [Candidatus Micrarchaeota archaeon]|nr:hypothetical protein [Candidatus Micrarchaeota archaeon]
MFNKLDKSTFMARAKSGVRSAMASPDHALVQIVSAIDDINKMANLASERLTEWYGLHFPEYRNADPIKYAEVALMLDRTNLDEAALTQLVGVDAATGVLHRAKTSMGVAFSPEDLAAVRAQAQLVLSMYTLRGHYEKYQEDLANRLCPNMSFIAGPAVAAKLVAQAGGLAKLATLPASTIQVLGAEKALFKHLKSGSPPPKHGLIFQHPLISTAPKRARGKIARALAAKLTIASKADAISHHFIADKLKEQFEARAQKILEMAKNAPERPDRPQARPAPVYRNPNVAKPYPTMADRKGGDESGSPPSPPPGASRPAPARRMESAPRAEGGERSGAQPWRNQNRPDSGPRESRGPSPYGSGERPRYEKRSYGANRPAPNYPPAGERPPRAPYGTQGSDERPRYGGDRPRFGGPKREGGFRSGPREGGFGGERRGPRPGGFSKGPREGGFSRGPRSEGGRPAWAKRRPRN